VQEEGIIKKINGDIATVAFVKKGGCGGGCSSCKSGCPKDTILVELKNTEHATVGERVLVSMDDILGLCLPYHYYSNYSYNMSIHI